MALKTVSEELILDRLHFENPWWKTGEIDIDYDQMPRRLFFSAFYDLISLGDVRRSVVLMGPRRVGKTVMMHHAISSLIRSGVSPRKIVYVNIENPVFFNISLDQLFQYGRRSVADDEHTDW